MPISKHLFLTFFLGLLSLGLSMNSVHAATTASASVTQNKVTKDEVFVLRVSVNEKVSSDSLTLDVLTNDFYIGRPSFGSSMNIINGTRTVQSEWTVTLAPLRSGSLTIPSFNIEGAKTRPIPIKVSINKLAPTQNDMAEFELELNTTQLYPGENGQLDVTLVIKADPRRLQNPQIAPPSSVLSNNSASSNNTTAHSNNASNAKGLDVTPIGDSKQYQDVRNGVEVTVVQQSFSLSSSTPGDYTLLGPKLTGSVVYSDNRSNKTRLFQLDTPVKTFAVTVLPVPSDYKGDWLPTQKLTLNQTWEDSTGTKIAKGSHIELNVGDSLTRTITMSAKGIAQHQLPNLALINPETVRVYDEKPKFGQTESGDAIVVFQQVLIPKQPGSFTLPAVTQTWFNTTTKTQETSSLVGLTFTAIANASETAAIEPKKQTQPVTSETVTVTDAGIWPYISLMFAILWIGSSAIAFHFWKQKPSSQADTNTQIKGSTDNTQQALISALEKRDGLQVETVFEVWRNEHKNVSLSDLDAIQNEIKSFTNELYGKNATSNPTWESDTVIKLIRKQKASKTTTEESVLQKL